MPTVLEPHVRRYSPADLPDVYDICVQTANAGGDARGHYSADRLMGDLFAAPYVILEPEHAHLLDDGSGTAVGYVLGTADTAHFVDRYRTEWIPALAGVWPPPPNPPVTAQDALLSRHYRPERMLLPELAGYPAHLHIDLLPQWQRRGYGRALIGAFLAGLAAAGVPAVHLGMARTNIAAGAFYTRLGFTEIPVPRLPDATFFGRSTAGPAEAGG